MPKSNDIFLDYAAGANPNPSSIHALGVKAKALLQKSREEVANILKARPAEIIFTSGGTESNNLAIQGVVLASHNNFKINFKLPHIITTNIEHPSVLETFKLLEKRKQAEISIIEVESNGIVDPKKIKREIKPNTVLVSVMYVNNEIGTIQPISEIAREIRHYNKKTLSSLVLFHTDAVQAGNYLNLNVEKLGIDLLSLSGSKIEGAGRIGVLYKKKSVELSPIFGGGDQEFGLRPGTENLAEISKFANAFKLAEKNKEKEIKRLKKIQDYFIKKLQKISKTSFDVVINGDLEERLPNNINVTFTKIPSDLLVIELSAKGVMVSSKSACESAQRGGSYVIKALRPNSDPEIGAVRFSLGKDTQKVDIDYTLKVLSQILFKLKKWYN
jgi:cysteine desulfurase